MKPKIVILDTNFLLIPELYRVDVFEKIKELMNEPYELYIMDKTIDELNKIVASAKTKDKEAAKLALQLVKQKGLKSLPCSSTVDECILNGPVDYAATQDRDLKRALKAKGVKIITLRQKHYLKVE
ncbi:MAG: PIN domain-containing protein [Nanoarchaeota archaeon]